MHNDYTPSSELGNKGNSAHQGFGPILFRSLRHKTIPASPESEWVDFYAEAGGMTVARAHAEFYEDVRRGEYVVEAENHHVRRLLSADRLYLRRFSDGKDSALCLFATRMVAGAPIEGIVSKLEVKHG